MKLSEITIIITKGTTPTTLGMSFSENGINFIKSESITLSRDLDHTKFVYISEKTHDKLKRSQLQENDILFSMAGVYLGKTAIVKKEEIPANTNQAVAIIRVDAQKADYEYVYYWLNDRSIKEYVNGCVAQSAQPNFNLKQIGNIEIHLPPLPEQRTIAATLSCLDAKIANNTKINHHLEQMAQAIFKSWFTDFEPFGGTMPDDWREGAINDIATDIVCGKTPSTKIPKYFGDDVPFITIPDMHGRTYVTTTERSLSVAGAISQSSKTVPANSVCVSCIATAGLVILTSKASQTNQQINTIVCKEGVSPFYVYLAMVRMADHIKMLGSSGSATNNLNKGQFSKIEILIPATRDLDEFSSLATPIFEKIKRIQQESESLAAIRDALLPRLMSGELHIPYIVEVEN